jgi:hypothetical protein
MGDEDFNFPPSERRETKRFEPPPWERDAFDELSRAKEAEEGAARAAEAAQAAEAAAAIEVAAARASDVVAAADAEQQAATTAASGDRGGVTQAAVEEPSVSEAQVTEMMAGLREEEPTSMQSYSAIAIALSVFTGLVGVVMLVWARAMFVSAAARGTGRVGMISGSIVAFFGALFIGLSMWVAVRALRQRGVL